MDIRGWNFTPIYPNILFQKLDNLIYLASLQKRKLTPNEMIRTRCLRLGKVIFLCDPLEGFPRTFYAVLGLTTYSGQQPNDFIFSRRDRHI